MGETLLAQHVRRCLARKGMSITQFALEAGIERPHIYRLFKVKRPRNETLRRVAAAIDEDAAVLFDLVEKEGSDERFDF